MKLLIFHFKLRSKSSWLRGGGPGLDGDKLSESNELEAVCFDSDSEEILDKIVESQEDEGLQFDSESEAFLELEMENETSELDTEKESDSMEIATDTTNAQSTSKFVKYEFEFQKGCSGCNKNCEFMFDQWREEDQNEMKQIFHEMKKIDRKNYVLDHMKKQRLMGQPLSGFFWSGHMFCFKSFAKISGISEYLLTLSVKASKENLVKFEHSSKGVEKLSAASIGFIVWVKWFSLQFGQYSPDELVIVLPGHLRKVDLWRFYQEDTSVQQSKVSESSFYRLFDEKFSHKRTDRSLPWVRISKFTTHSKCDNCLILDQKRRKAKTVQEIDLIKALSYKHMESQNRSRIHIQTLRHKCLSFPSEYLLVQGRVNLKYFWFGGTFLNIPHPINFPFFSSPNFLLLKYFSP